MGKIILLFAILVLFGLNLVSAQTKNKLKGTNEVQEIIEKERVKLKNSAFCMCLNKQYPGYDKMLNDGSAAGYFEKGLYNVEVLEPIDSLLVEYNKREYKSKSDRNLGIMKCLDFYNSKELDGLVKSLDSELDMEKLKTQK